ncbi:uncharacterized protein H6S33_012085 [Morchella sextelata]|uniref:uncharacterized protein n=1 Tax=Morchella sextelata TaxID=1174677 RepID=UPI001D052EF7|nr:uncharacterized protein H6S33_012085 [Morchella sextelata]KAH0610558.1 hypothetical protein H6S33_012085 [Morchella sextelata]
MPAPATIPASSLAVHRSELSLSLRCKIRALRSAALWPFRKIGKELGVPLSTVYSICQQPFTPVRPRMGRPLILTKPIRLQLIATATSSQANRRKPLMQIAEEIGITVNPRTLRKTFADAGYHRRVARVKPFLSPAAKIKRMNWADNLRGWDVADYQKIIWTDECAFNVGGFAGNTWVTRLPEEEYVEDCLVPKFRKLQTIMVWGCIYGNTKGPLVFWDKKEWGNTINGPGYCQNIVRPYLYPFWQQKSQVLDYVYIMHDGAPPHRAKFTTNVLEELGARTPKCTTNISLRAAIEEEWNAISPEEIASLINTLPERVEAVRAVRGGHTKY